MADYHSYGRKWRGTEEPLDESERGEWKSWLKTQHIPDTKRRLKSSKEEFMKNRERIIGKEIQVVNTYKKMSSTL